MLDGMFNSQTQGRRIKQTEKWETAHQILTNRNITGVLKIKIKFQNNINNLKSSYI